MLKKPEDYFNDLAVAKGLVRAFYDVLPGQVPLHTKATIKDLLSIIDVVEVAFLEKKTRKTSGNSGLPPSQNGPNGNRNGKGKGRSKAGDKLNNTKKEETSETISAKNCNKCGRDLSSTSSEEVDERKIIDVIYTITEHTVRNECKNCPDCGHKNKAPFPAGMSGKLQYGISLKSNIINFSMIQMISLERIQEHYRGIIGRNISQSIMLKYVSHLSELLKNWETQKIKKLLQASVIHCDETSLRVNKKKYWIHSYSSGNITLKFLHKTRGIQAIEDIGILPKYGGTIVHDCWGSYFSYAHLKHSLCGAHLLRELKFVEDSTGDKWATSMKKLLQEAAKTVAGRTKKRTLNAKEYKKLQSRYRSLLKRGKKELPSFPEATGKRGRPKNSDAQNLWLRLYKHEKSVLLFAKMKDCDFTNNRAERDLRDAKLKQKVSGTFRKVECAKHFVRISSYVKSMRYQDYSSLEAIMMALQGEIPP